MARIPYPDPAIAARPRPRRSLAKIGDPPMNIFRMLAGGEGLLRAFSRFGNHLLFKSKLDPVLREIAIVRVGVLSDATYEVYQHDRISRGIGMSEELLAGIRNGADDPVFDDIQAPGDALHRRRRRRTCGRRTPRSTRCTRRCRCRSCRS